MRQSEKLAVAVIHQAHIDTLLGFARQNLQNLPPHRPLGDNKIFQKDKVLGFLQFCQHRLKFRLAGGKIGYVCSFIYRKAAAPVHILC